MHLLHEDLVLIAEGLPNADFELVQAFTAYKTVDRRVKPVSGTFPQEALVRQTFPHDPLDGVSMARRGEIVYPSHDGK